VDVLAPPPSPRAYPHTELDELFSTDLAGWDVLPVGRAGGEVAVADGRLSVTSDRLVHLVFRSITALGCGRLARSGLRSFARSRRSVCSP
jgi:hypothetical protein